ncbi:MAG TPA: phosphate signaling complex protein PhoU [Methanomicrobia archaeon]|nr:phosphate signaling complex protein PhoU [Methanomicrobia archaeon]
MKVRKEYLDALEKLKKDTLKMGELSQIAAKNAIAALVNHDKTLASNLLEANSVIDKIEFEIENQCMRLLALQQPMAGDLRLIGTCLKIITDLDRISDLAGDIAEIVVQIADEPYAKPLIDIPRISEITQGMLTDCLAAFETQKIEQLQDFSERDDLVDGLFGQIRRELVAIMIENPRAITSASHLIFIALHQERIADHACNIASRIIYMVTGERKKLE